MKAIEIDNLIKDYGSFRALNGISFSVDDGEIFGLIGPNGAGKTTTLRILSTLLKSTAGSAKIYDLNVKDRADQVRKIISYLPEQAGAYKMLTGKKYLEFISRFFEGGDKAKKMVDDGINIADLGDRIYDRVDTYSKGMIRRLLVARALMTKPKLAILDEPTSGLDVINAQEIRKIIISYVKAGKSALISSHNMLEVEFLCQNIALINKGKIIEIGSPNSLKEKYKAKNIEEVFMKVIR